jgi:hypothetical protein
MPAQPFWGWLELAAAVERLRAAAAAGANGDETQAHAGG